MTHIKGMPSRNALAMFHALYTSEKIKSHINFGNNKSSHFKLYLQSLPQTDIFLEMCTLNNSEAELDKNAKQLKFEAKI